MTAVSPPGSSSANLDFGTEDIAKLALRSMREKSHFYFRGARCICH